MKIAESIYSYLIPQPSQKEDHRKQSISISSGNNTPICGLPSIYDSLVRGIGRYYETFMDNYFLRVPFRFATEVFRYLTSRAFLNCFTKEKTDKQLLITGIKKSLEITLGTALVDPNRQTNHFERMKTGFLNMVARLGIRLGFVGLNILDKKHFSFKTLIDEFLSRTLCRMIYLDSNDLIIGIGCRTFEQFVINEWVRKLPFGNQILLKLLNNKFARDPNYLQKEAPLIKEATDKTTKTAVWTVQPRHSITREYQL